MAWSAPVAGAGLAYTAANFVTYVLDNLRYFKGHAGTLTYESGVAFENDAAFLASIVSSNPRITFDTNDYIDYVRASNQFRFTINSVVEMLLVATGITYSNSFYSLETVAAKSHLETGVSTMDILLGASSLAYADDAYTFIKPFNDLPVVVHGVYHTTATDADYAGIDVLINRNTLTKTGVTLRKFAKTNTIVISQMMALGTHD